MRTREELEQAPQMGREQARECLRRTVGLVEQYVPEFTDCFPASNSENGYYPKSDNTEWTTGFWTGEIWLAYEAEEDPAKQALLRAAGETQVESFLDRIIRRVDVDHHDMGFLYTPSCVAADMLTGNETARRAALLAADNLMAVSREGPVLPGLGRAGGAGQLPADHRLPVKYAVTVLGQPGDRAKRVRGPGQGPHQHGHELRDPGRSLHLPHLLL